MEKSELIEALEYITSPDRRVSTRGWWEIQDKANELLSKLNTEEN